jgi:uncharacterized membrane protein (DUF2068 family)
MAEDLAISSPSKKAPTLYFIAGLKIFKGLLLLMAALWVYALAGKDLPEIFDKFLGWFHLDPENRFFASISDWLGDVRPANERKFALVFFVYGLFLATSGTGLALRATWAIWLAIGESAFFIPIEVYEIVKRRLPQPQPEQHHIMMVAHPRLGLAVVLGLNILIVWYLYKNRNRLFKHHG